MKSKSELLDDENKAFCVMPWMHTYRKFKTGETKPCCLASSGYFLSDESKDFHFYEIREIRKQMLDGIRPSSCNYCYKIEDFGKRSPRLQKNQKYEKFIPAIMKAAVADGSTTHKIYSADFRLSNLCNLKCRMCNKDASSLFEQEENKRFGIKESSDAKLEVPDTDEFWIQFFAENEDLFSLELSGGEPLVNKRFFWIVEHLTKTQKSKNISLQFHTNLTRLPEQIFEAFKEFREVKIFVSIDGVDEVNSYIRFPSNWNHILKNIQHLNSHLQWPFQRLHFHIVVQAYNLFNVVPLLEFMMQFDRFQPALMTVLDDPDFLSVKVLPNSARLAVAEDLKSFLGSLKTRRLPPCWSDFALNSFVESINTVICFLGEEGSGLLPQFVDWTKDLDSYRQQSVVSAIPQLAEYF